MRWLLSLLVLSTAFPVVAETIDCAALKSTPIAFEVTSDWTRTKPGEEPITKQTLKQVSRKPEGTIISQGVSPRVFLRETYSPGGFLMEYVGTSRRTVSYSVDTAKDYDKLGQPFEFDATIKDGDGAIISELHTSVTFDDDIDIEISGCKFSVKRSIRVSRGTVNGKSGTSRGESWISPELQTSLYSRSANFDGTISEYRARSLATSFTPLQ
jgi:hypothetical protein